MKKLCILIIAIGSSLYGQMLPREYFHKQISKTAIEQIKADSIHSYDALHYEITMEIDPQEKFISGNVMANLCSKENGLSQVSYELVGLNVDSVFVDAIPADFVQDSLLITIDLNSTYDIGEEFTTQVYYSGYPILSSDGYACGMHFDNAIWTYADPNGARYWWPCYDHPWDKTTTKMIVTVPDSLVVASNGLLIETIDNGDGTVTYNWQENSQIATYLVSLAIYEYVEINQTFNDTIPIQSFVYPSHYDWAVNDFQNVPLMMQIYSDLYGDYPHEKYGMAECAVFGGNGAMEHQTITSLGHNLIDGQQGGEMIITHELAHQWFGDCLTPLTWKDVWLSEGFAVYSEALYVEGKDGFAAFTNYVKTSIHDYYKNWAGGSVYRIYDPPYHQYFYPYEYEKAASVLQMLRFMLGDENFFLALKDYFQTYKHSNVVTSDFQGIVQQYSTENLDYFFDEWIYGYGLPNFQTTVYYNDNGDLIASAQSFSNSDTDFQMWIPLDITTIVSGDTITNTLKVWAEPELFTAETQRSKERYNYFSLSYTELSYEGEIISIDWNKDSWVLERGIDYQKPQLDYAYAGDEKVVLYWNQFFDENIEGYNVYRSQTSGANYQKINASPITDLFYVDEDVQNGHEYFYVITAVLDDANSLHTEFSDEYASQPISFPLDKDILLIDETYNGTGSMMNPTDAEVDSFYHTVLENYSFTDIEINSGDSLPIDTLAQYSTVIWYDDDFLYNFIGDYAYTLASYLIGGGNLFISGWRTAENLPNSLLRNFFGCEQICLNNDPDFAGAIGQGDYPDLDVNGDLVVWDDVLAYISIFQNVLDDDILYRYNGQDSLFQNQAVMIKNFNDDYDFALSSFPLYYMDESDVTAFFSQLMTEFDEPTPINNNLVLSTTKPVLYNSPNPFNPSTTITFSIPKKYSKHNPELKIYNIKGEVVRELNIQSDKSDMQKIIWNGKDDNNRSVSSGIYFYQLKCGEYKSPVKKMCLIK